jgi:hypothetical protein
MIVSTELLAEQGKPTAIDASNRVKKGPLTVAVICSAAATIRLVASTHFAAALSAAPGVKGSSS